MKPMLKGLLLALVHLGLVLAVAGKYYMDRNSYPRAWAPTAPFDPNLPIRGRYVRLQVIVEASNTPQGASWVRLAARGGRLVATSVGPGEGRLLIHRPDGRAVLADPVAYFIPEHVADPSRRPPGEELWVEVSVPREGPPRPIRLGVLKDGVLAPLTPH